jgi:hypothetical protein
VKLCFHSMIKDVCLNMNSGIMKSLDDVRFLEPLSSLPRKVI